MAGKSMDFGALLAMLLLSTHCYRGGKLRKRRTERIFDRRTKERKKTNEERRNEIIVGTIQENDKIHGSRGRGTRHGCM